HSLRRLLDTLPNDVLVYPTHGAGSFCGATMGGTPVRRSTIAQERIASPAAHVHDEAEFVRQQLAGYGVYPAYYSYMGDINQQGPRILGGLPPLLPLAPRVVRSNLDHGVPLIDGRPRQAFAKEHVPGAFNIELDASFGTYVGWLLPFNKPLMLLIDDAAGREEAVAQLIRIGYEQLRGYLDGGVDAWKAAGFPTNSFEAIDIDELHRRWQRHEPLAVLDVRDATEWGNGHIPGSLHIHIGDLMRHLNEIPREVPVATVCRTGHRAEMAASIVAALGRQTIAVQRGGIPDWLAQALPAEYDRPVEIAAARELDHVHP
ncbi:MAG: rhodanese-like domain-containing protein, partial [Ktedonobacterales bacterium]